MGLGCFNGPQHTLQRGITMDNELVAAHSAEGSLHRGSLSLFETVSSTLANIAPAMSVFLAIGAIVATMGSTAPWGFVAGAVAILTTGNTLAQFAQRMPTTGSFVAFINRGIGSMSPVAGKAASGIAFFLLVIAYPISLASVVIFLGSWIQGYFGLPSLDWILFAMIAVALVIPLLLTGTGISVRTSFILFVTEAVGLLVFAVAVIAQAGSHAALPLHSVGGSPGGIHGVLGITFAIVVFGYVGWENSGPLGEESKNPRRTIPMTIVISVGIIALLFVASTWAVVAGYGAWYGNVRGMNILASGSVSAPFIALARHYAPALVWWMVLIGVTSALGAFLSAAVPITRIMYHGARAGLLPKAVSRVGRRSGVPIVSMWTYIVGTVACILVPMLFLGTNPGTLSADLAGISTVPILIVYVLANLSLPIYIWRNDRSTYQLFTHLVLPILGIIIVGYGTWISIQPNQAPPANWFWLWVLGMVVLSAVATGIVAKKNPQALTKLGDSLENVEEIIVPHHTPVEG